MSGFGRSSRIFSEAALVACAVLLGTLVVSGYASAVVGIAAVAVLGLLAYRFPVTVASAYLLVAGALSVFQMTPGYDSTLTTVVGGVRVEDLLLAGILCAMWIRLATPDGRRDAAELLPLVVALSVWLTFSIVRNFSEVGVSALGEYRFQYLALSLPLFLMISLRTYRQILNALRAFVFIAVAVPLTLSPLVLYLNGWSLGPASRVFPSHVSLGILIGLVVLWRCRELLPLPSVLLWTYSVLGAVEVLTDAHRSVWIAAMGMGAALVYIERRSGWFQRVVVPLVVMFMVVVFVSTMAGLDLAWIVADRAGAAVGVQDTAAWRWDVWKSSMQYVVASPFAGRGLGLYWSTYVPELGGVVTAFPHSAYVMILVHLGAVGLALLMAVAYRVARLFVRPTLFDDFGRVDINPLSSVGLAALCSILAYAIAYSFEPYSLFIVGVCLAATLRPPSSSTD